VLTPLEEWLKKHDLEGLLPLFVENEVDMRALGVLTAEDLKELGVPFGPRKRLLSAIAESKRDSTPRPTEGGTRPGAVSIGERRQLTVMFCDLVGSTALSTQLDPEELHGLITTYRNTCCEVVARYGGHVAQYLGDGLMIYFGWPVAHEDAAERGVRSALEMVQAVKSIPAATMLAVRIGLATGPVVVGDNSRDGNAESVLAIGETPNLAARVQGAARPGEVLIAPATRRLIADAFVLTDVDMHSLKGIALPVQLWRVEDARRTEGRFRAAHGVADITPLVGRDHESRLLADRWRLACGGEGQAVLVGGQPGIGKSRLIQDLRENITGPHDVLHYQCSPYHLNSPLHPFIDQLELSAGFARDDAPEQRLDKLEAVLVGEANSMEETAALFAALLSLPTDRYESLNLSPRRQKERTLDALAARIVTLARQKPLLMVFEDVHWIDPSSQELLDLLLAKFADLPMLLVMTARPEAMPSWATHPGVTILALSRLGRTPGAQLIETITKGRALPAEVLAEILARTDGVPLFVQELTRSVLESGLLRADGNHLVLNRPLESFEIPVSLRDSLMARLDRLGPVKELAQLGSCIGREFSFDLLDRISSLDSDLLAASLDSLVEAGLVTRNHQPPDATYTFTHALVQDAAYDSLLKAKRLDLHARIADVIEADFTERVDKKPEWLAHHRTQAGQFTWAIPLWQKAGTIAVGRVALKEAVAHFQKGLTLVDQLPQSAERDGFELAIREPLNAAWTGLRGWAAGEVADNVAAILRLAESGGNAQSLLLATWWVWTSTITRGHIADSQQWADRLLAGAGQRGDMDTEIFGHATGVVQSFLSGRLAESHAHFERVVALYDPRHAAQWIQLTGHGLRTFVEVYACQLLWMLGFPDQATRLADQARLDAQQDGHAFNRVWALTFSAYVFAYRRDTARFLDIIDEADTLAREQGLAFIYEVSVPQARGVAALQNRRPGEAIDLLKQGIGRWTGSGGNVRVPYLKSVLAEAVALDGDADAALLLVEECLGQIDSVSGQERLWLAEVLRIKGCVLIRKGRDDEAEAVLRAAIKCARQQQARSWELRSAKALAELLARRGQRDAARELLAPICGWFTEGADTKDLVEARALIGELAS